MKKRAVLAIDMGNTNVTVGLCRGGRVVRRAKIPTRDRARYRGALRAFCRVAPDAVAVSSVVPTALAALLGALSDLYDCPVHVAGRNTTVPIRNRYRKKREVGQDRLVNAFAARELYGRPAVIIDFGTAVTFDVVSREGDYLGGLIMPGVGISLGSLYEKTALLPRVELRHAPSIIGRDTVNSMRGGILFGFGAMCDGLISRYKKIMGRKLVVVVTGGNARLIKRYISASAIIDEDLTLKGLEMLVNKKVS